MAITRKTPTIVHLAGDNAVHVGDVPAGAAITPGNLIQYYNDSGTLKFRKHADAGVAGSIYALDQPEFNKGLSDNYAAGDMVKAAVMSPGCVVYALIASGQNITQGGLLESAGDGTLKAASSGVAVAVALESVNNSAGPSTARLQVETL